MPRAAGVGEDGHGDRSGDQDEGSGGGTAAPPPAASPPGPVPVALVGDRVRISFTRRRSGRDEHTALLADRAEWTATNLSVYGSGYVAGAPMGEQVAKAVDARPTLVVVSGGRADVGQDPVAVRDAAARLYRDVTARLPGTKIVVIGPMWIGGDAPIDVLDVRDAIRDSAVAAQLPFVDPIDERWFNGSDRDGLTPNGENLNDRGHQRLAVLVDDALRKTNALPQ